MGIYALQDTVLCSRCSIRKSMEEFHSSELARKGGHRCKRCRKEMQDYYRSKYQDKVTARNMLWRANNPEKWKEISKRSTEKRRASGKTRADYLRYKYGMSIADWESMRASQNGVCRICLREKKLFVDHDHKTGKVRGLLCSLCNRILGQFQDNPDQFERAADYLKAGVL